MTNGRCVILLVMLLSACGQDGTMKSFGDSNNALKNFNGSIPKTTPVYFKASTAPVMIAGNVNFAMKSLAKNFSAEKFFEEESFLPFEYLKNKINRCHYLQWPEDSDECEYDPMDELAMVANSWNFEDYAKWMDFPFKQGIFSLKASFNIKLSKFINNLDSIQVVNLWPILYYPQSGYEQKLKPLPVNISMGPQGTYTVSFEETVSFQGTELPILVFKVYDFYVNETIGISYKYQEKIKQMRDNFATFIIVTPYGVNIEYIHRDEYIPGFMKKIDPSAEIIPRNGVVYQFGGLSTDNTNRWHSNLPWKFFKGNFNQSGLYILSYVSSYDFDFLKISEPIHQFEFVRRHDFDGDNLKGSYIGIIQGISDINCLEIDEPALATHFLSNKLYVELKSLRYMALRSVPECLIRKPIEVTIQRARFSN